MRYIISILIFLIAFNLGAQTPTQDKDVKVGLVLSGGGAKGFAHIGVLKEIERAGIRLDYISGTSMGAVIGGLYASGYSAAQLDSLFRSIDFNALIQDQLPRGAKTFYERDNQDRYAAILPFNNFKLSLPTSFSKGQNTYNLLSQSLSHVDSIADFSKLPIPFLCIATDVVKGEEVILDGGYLPEVISASGALPSLFSPVSMGDKLLIDGGVINNYPVEELKARGMEVIIGVDVQDTLKGKEGLKSATDVLIQINNYRTVKDMERKTRMTDVLIRPDIDEYSVVSFDKGGAIIDLGEKKAKEKEVALKAIASRQGAVADSSFVTFSRKHTPTIKKSDSLDIIAVNITGSESYTRSYVLGKLKFIPPARLSIKDFYDGINNLSATKNFDKINHRLQTFEDGKVLYIDLNETKNTQFIKLGLHYDDLYRSAALVNFTKKRVLFKNDVLSLDFIVGDNIRYDFDYYVDKGFYWSVGMKSTFTSFSNGISARLLEQIRPIELPGLNRVTLDFQDITNKVFLQTILLKDFSFDIGIQHKFLDVETDNIVSTQEGEVNLIFDRSNYLGAYAQLRYDSLDDKYFPKSGFFFDGDFDLYLYSSDYNDNFSELSIANADFMYAQPITKEFTVISSLAGGFKIGGGDSRSLDFFLGGYGAKKVNNLVPFLGYDFLGIAGDGYVKFGLELDYEIFKNNHITADANFANVGFDLFSSPTKWLPPPEYSGYSLGYGIETFLGPLEAKYSYSPEIKEGNWFVSLGFQF